MMTNPIVSLGLLIAGVESVVAQILDIDTVLNIMILLVAALAAVPLMKSKAKDQTIKDLNDSLIAADRREDDLKKEVAGAQTRANAMEEACKFATKEKEKWEARYQEQSKYTAKGAVTHMEQLLVEHREQVAQRHEHMIDALDKLTEVLINNKSERGPEGREGPQGREGATGREGPRGEPGK